MKKFSRGQVFTADFLIAAAVLMLVVGISLHVSEIISRSLLHQSAVSSNTATAFAEAIVASPPFHLNNTRYCTNWNNGTSNCTGSRPACPDVNVLAARRLVNCTNSNTEGVCVLEVRACT